MKKNLYWIISALLLVIFIVFTILVKTVDVKFITDIGPLGFYDLNIRVNETIQSGNTQLFSKVSDILMYLSFVPVAIFAGIGVYELIKRKSLLKVDKILYVLLAGYVLVACLYVVFEIARVNYSPLSTKEELKQSYPSSHVLITCSFYLIGLIGLYTLVKTSRLIKILLSLCATLLITLSIVTRTLSGHHYLTDIIGSVLLVAFVSTTVYSLKRTLGEKGLIEEK